MSKQEPLNAKGERGVLVHTGSIAGEEAIRGQVGYGASKGGIKGMVMPMARDLGRFGIRVVNIAPSPFDTPMIAKSNEMERKMMAA
jgi:NAD(P)-dependent dehydrogenase (short-subunit alcohol dehydrogenase family)